MIPHLIFIRICTLISITLHKVIGLNEGSQWVPHTLSWCGFNMLSTQKNIVYSKKSYTQAQLCFGIEMSCLVVPVANLDRVVHRVWWWLVCSLNTYCSCWLWVIVTLLLEIIYKLYIVCFIKVCIQFFDHPCIVQGAAETMTYFKLRAIARHGFLESWCWY